VRLGSACSSCVSLKRWIAIVGAVKGGAVAVLLSALQDLVHVGVDAVVREMHQAAGQVAQAAR
jgi:hypothetical protein